MTNIRFMLNSCRKKKK